jgi:sialate O-acetylesterase
MKNFCRKKCSECFLRLLFICLSGTHVYADVQLMSVFSSNMVLQRDAATKIAGWADVGEAIVIKLGDQVVGQAVGLGQGKSWSVALPVLKAGPIPNITIEGKNTLVLSNLLAGDVWVCSGQSNMEMTLANGPWCRYGGVLNAQQEVAAASSPNIRVYISGNKKPWMECSPENAKIFSATGYFFGRELEQQLGIPIGLLVAAAGGSPAEYWTPKQARQQWSGYEAASLSAKKVLAELKPQFDADLKAVAEWQQAAAEAQKNAQPVPECPKPKLTKEQGSKVRWANHVDTVGNGYNARVKPLTAMAIKGVIWYQGESNAERSSEYVELMSQLIESWRKEWGQGDFPFLIMQLVSFESKTGNWPALRAAQQTLVKKSPNTGMAVGIDLGEANDIHPKNKQEIGRRLALLALKNVYGKKIVASGPCIKSATIDGKHVKVAFDVGGANQKLVLKSLNPSGFEIAGADGVFYPADALIRDSEVMVSAESVQNPTAIRYAWADNPPATVFNSEGLPAAPFLKTLGDLKN